jgi:flagellar biogenesis protein FliO
MRPKQVAGFSGLVIVLLVGASRPAITAAQSASSFNSPAAVRSSANQLDNSNGLDQLAGRPERIGQATFPVPPSSLTQSAIPDQTWTGTRSPQATTELPSLRVPQATEQVPEQATPFAPYSAGAQQDLRPSNLSSQTNVVPASFETPVSSKPRTVLQPKSKAESSQPSSASGGKLQMLISVGSSLAIVIGLFIGVAMLYRKTLASTIGKGLPKTVVQVLGRTAVAPRQQLVLLRFGSKLVLVSMIQGEARTISEITDPLEVDQLAGLCESTQPASSSNSFRELLFQGVKA